MSCCCHLLLVLPPCFAALLPIPLQVAMCCCHCHLLCSRLIVDLFFTLVLHSSHVCLSYAAATVLLSASLLIAVPHCCQCHCCCCCHRYYCKLIVAFWKYFAVAVKAPLQLLFCACCPIDWLWASQSSAVSVAVRSLCALSAHLLVLLPLLLLSPSLLGFCCCWFLWQSLALLKSCWKLMTTTFAPVL